ncbi:hypothetical protein AVEN_224184-1 [Araneus ventricosus]|uniref:Uncharacterized protein n=1 Tax=Araneus ventricosus TaxID=182803 RepID=A0A4Y2T522_ARAVE|nr:hypothetical protein AVEN_224184-1 [Araneus ventricosus]
MLFRIKTAGNTEMPQKAVGSYNSSESRLNCEFRSLTTSNLIIFGVLLFGLPRIAHFQRIFCTVLLDPPRAIFENLNTWARAIWRPIRTVTRNSRVYAPISSLPDKISEERKEVTCSPITSYNFANQRFFKT